MSVSCLNKDVLFNIGKYLKASECLKINSSFSILYENHAKRIQFWYKKYKKIRDTRYKILYTEYKKDDTVFDKMSYMNIHLFSYDLKNLRDILNQDYGLYKFTSNTYNRREYFHLIENTVKNPTYTNLKKFLRTRIERLKYLQSLQPV